MDTSHAYYLTIVDLIPKLNKEHATELGRKLKFHIEFLEVRASAKSGMNVTMDTPLIELDLSVRAYNAIMQILNRADIRLGDIAGMSESNFHPMPHAEQIIAEINTMLRLFGKSLNVY
jgi:hypothetical protein